MARTVRNLITDAYRESGVLGIGMTLQSYQLSEGLSSLNNILDEVYSENAGQTPSSFSVTFNGADSYTVGPAPENPVLTPELVPDIELPILPSDISLIVVQVGGVRCNVSPCTPEKYFSRTLNTLSNEAPDEFFFERNSPLGTVRFLDGTPSGQGEIIFKPCLVDVGANSDMRYFPREIRPFLVYSLAARVAANNSFDNQELLMRANKAWNKYAISTYQGQDYICDASAPGVGSRSYNIYKGD